MSPDLQNSVVLIISRDPSNTYFGTGFVIHQDEQAAYLLTCAHVVRDVGSEMIEISGIQARVIASGSEDGIDLAVLRVEGLPTKLPLPLYATGDKGNPLSTAGFQLYGRRFLIRELHGTLGEQVGLETRGQADRIRAWDLKITDDYQLQRGYSGSPVVDENDNVIGVVNTRQGEGKKGLAISIEALEKIWPEMPPGLFRKLQALPMDARAITRWSNRDEAFVQVAQGIRKAVEELPSTSMPSQPMPAASGAPAAARARASAMPTDRNHKRMLKRVHATWIAGVLEPSLHGAALMVLGLEEKADALNNPWRLLLQEVDRPTQSLPEGTCITQVYNATEGGGLLILGEPGAGKTTLLLELARDLLDCAQTSENAPIPVVFNLSSWAKKRPALSDWLVEELSIRYEVPHRLGQSWISEDRLLLLLDGLDEVTSAARKECIEAINSYRQTHPDVQVVVCSRSTEYLNEPTQLRLHTAVVIQPLTQEQIGTYLKGAGKQAKALREALRQDADLRTLVTTPLMLTILLIAYRGISPDKINELASLDAKREQIFASYVQYMLKRRGASKRYQLEQITHWLAYLAQQMKRQSQTLFYIEQMQPDWLLERALQRIYTFLGVRLPGILIGVLVSLLFNVPFLASSNFIAAYSANASIVFLGLIGGLLGSLLSHNYVAQAGTTEMVASGKQFSRRLITRGIALLITGVVIGIGSALSFGALTELNNTNELVIVGEIIGLGSIVLTLLMQPGTPTQSPSVLAGASWKWLWHAFVHSKHARNGWLAGGIMGLSTGLASGLASALSHRLELQLQLRSILTTSLATGLNFGLLVGLIGVLLSLILANRSSAIQPVERLIWSWRSLWGSLTSAEHRKNVLRFGLLVALIIGLIGASLIWSNVVSGDIAILLSIGLMSIVPSIMMLYWLLFGLIQGVTGKQLDEQHRLVPNQSIYRSARNGLLFGFIGGSISLLACVLGIILFFVLSSIIALVIVFGLHMDIGATTTGLTGSTPSSVGTRIDLHFFLFPGLVLGASFLVIGLLTGWLACIRHAILRYLLWSNGFIPWNYPRFLDYAAERILLRKAGGGYLFVHRLILDYFASLKTPSPVEAAAGAAANAPSPTSTSAPLPDASFQYEVALPAGPSWKTRSHKEKLSAKLFVVVLCLLVVASNVSIFNEAQRADAEANAIALSIANAYPIAYPPRDLPPVLNDPLQNNQQGNAWEEDTYPGDCMFIGGEAFDISTDKLEWCPARATNFADFIYEVQMQIIKGDGGGIAFRINPRNDHQFYYLAMKQDGSYSVHFFNDSDTLLALGSSPAIHQGLYHINRVAVVVHDSILELYVNYQRVAVVGNISYYYGQIGLIADGTAKSTEVIFQNAKVWKL